MFLITYWNFIQSLSHIFCLSVNNQHFLEHWRFYCASPLTSRLIFIIFISVFLFLLLSHHGYALCAMHAHKINKPHWNIYQNRQNEKLFYQIKMTYNSCPQVVNFLHLFCFCWMCIVFTWFFAFPFSFSPPEATLRIKLITSKTFIGFNSSNLSFTKDFQTEYEMCC